MKNTPGIVKFLALILVAVVFVAGYFAFRFDNANESNIDTTPASSGWKTYTNASHGFSFDYPSGYDDLQIDKKATSPRYMIQNDGTLKEAGTATALLTLSANPTSPNMYPAMIVNVYRPDQYSFVDLPGGEVTIYNAKTKDFWVGNLGTTDPIREGRLEVVSGINITGRLVGSGDLGGFTQAVLFVDPQENYLVEMRFSSGVALEGSSMDDTNNVDVYKAIGETFTFTPSTDK